MLTSENFLSGAENLEPSDELALEKYLNTGGRALIVGQDLLWGAHETWGKATGFFKTHIGLDSVNQDTINGGVSVQIRGANNNILSGESFKAYGGGDRGIGPFNLNLLYIDTLTPVSGAKPLLWASGANPCAISYAKGNFKTVFSTVELAAIDTKSFESVLTKIMRWLTHNNNGGNPMPWLLLLLEE
jgi:hypothetical protein